MHHSEMKNSQIFWEEAQTPPPRRRHLWRLDSRVFGRSTCDPPNVPVALMPMLHMH